MNYWSAPSDLDWEDYVNPQEPPVEQTSDDSLNG
jgi:hypothetical protein